MINYTSILLCFHTSVNMTESECKHHLAQEWLAHKSEECSAFVCRCHLMQWHIRCDECFTEAAVISCVTLTLRWDHERLIEDKLSYWWWNAAATGNPVWGEGENCKKRTKLCAIPVTPCQIHAVYMWECIQVCHEIHKATSKVWLIW